MRRTSLTLVVRPTLDDGAMDALGITRVICENCGGTDWTAVAIGVVGVVIGALALIYAARASKVATRTLKVNEEQHAMAKAQHDLERQQYEQDQVERSARASFKLSVDIVNADAGTDGGMLTTEGNHAMVRLRIGIENVGDRVAGPTTVNVLLPAQYGGGSALRWCDEGGADIPDGPAPTTTSEQIGNGANTGPAVYLYCNVPTVSVRSPVILFMRFHVGPLREHPIDVPVRIKAQADELPHDIQEVTLDRVVGVRQPPL